MTYLKRIAVLLFVVVFCSSCARAFLPEASFNPWQVVSLPTDETLSDVSFVGDSNHGWLVGKNSTILETLDGGTTWEAKTLNLDEDRSFTFTSVSFANNEGWIVGQPSIMLHTTDGGKSWSRVLLSDKLPGMPNTVVALGPKSAEMTTDIGAIYRTSDAGMTWKAMVQEAVGVVRNISRSVDGKYVAVSARGNFYSTWEPGQEAWQPHNRNSSRRLQNMGFSQEGTLWLLARGGILQFNTTVDDLESWSDPVSPEFSTSWGLLDLAYRTPSEVWVAGGSGNLLVSFDGGATWQKDKAVENVPSNFYRIIFLSANRGFIIGQQGTLLKYDATAQPA